MKKSQLLGLLLLLISLLLSACVLNKTALSDNQKAKSNVKVPVLMYHHLSDNEKEWGSATVSAEKFKEDMLYLKALGFQTILPEDLMNYKEKGTPLPEQPILVTFDDGYESNYTLTYPILKELDMKAVINVIVSRVGKDTLPDGTPMSPHFSWEQAKEMIDSGLMDIQHHTYNLHDLGDGKYGKGVNPLKNETTEDYIARLKEDILLGEQAIEEHLGKKPILFAYPYGIFTDESENLLKELNYDISLTVKDGVAEFEDGLWLLNRINMPYDKKSPALMKTILNDLKLKKDIPFEKVHNASERVQQLENQLQSKTEDAT